MKHLKKLSLTLLLLITAVGGAWAQDTYTVAGSNEAMFGTAWDASNTANDMTKNGDGTYSITYTNVYLDGDVQYKVLKDHSWSEAYPDENRVITIAEAGTYTVTICFNPTTHEVYETMPGSDSGEPEVTINDDKTTASFEMPTNDVTVDYELVRDMSIQMTATMGDGNDGVRYRVKKDNNKFIPADMEMAAVPALFTVNDAIEQKALTQTQDYIVQIYAIDAEGQPTGQPMTFATFTFAPGIYAVKAVAADGSDYDGETALSNTFQLFQGYEVTVGAGKYATYYKDEALKVEDADAQLYTVSSVGATTATLSGPYDAMKSSTPMLVYNKGTETKTFLLIPCNEPDLAVTVAPEFKGTLEAMELPASSATTDYYVCTGSDFILVTSAGTIGANKCWLEVSKTAAQSAPRLTIGGGGGNTTGIDGINASDTDKGDWYDLNGRKVATPTRKGIYIKNGKKVVIK